MQLAETSKCAMSDLALDKLKTLRLEAFTWLIKFEYY